MSKKKNHTLGVWSGKLGMRDSIAEMFLPEHFVRYCGGPARRKQMPAGHLYLDGFESPDPMPKKKNHTLGVWFFFFGRG